MKIIELIDLITRDLPQIHGKPAVTIPMLGAIIRNLQQERVIRKPISYGTLLRASRKIKPLQELPGSPAFFDAAELAKAVDKTKKTRLTPQERKEEICENNMA